MDRIDFTNLGGFPFSATRADAMQQNYLKALAAIAAFIGDKVIISGVTVAGSNVSDGWIVYNGELIKFVGGSLGDGVVVAEAATSFSFQNGATYPIVFTKTATCGVPATFNFSDLVRLDTIQNSVCPKGIISMWSGTIANIPTGWALCDGTNGTPNLSGKFIVGYNATDGDYNAIGNAGGEKQHTLTVNEIPAHAHNQQVYTAVNNGGRKPVGYANTLADLGDSGVSTLNTGGGQAHENRPPYYTLAYIIKL